jgi:hypothetical protein
VDNVQKEKLKQAGLASLDVIFRHLSGRTENKHGIPQTVWPHIRTVTSRHEVAVLPTQPQPSMIYESYITLKKCLAKVTIKKLLT